MKMSQNKLFELTSETLSETHRVLVAGDIHGDYESLRGIRRLFNPERDHLIFLGDYADRGPKGIEVIDGVGELVRKYPSRVTALKGNHEDYTEDGRPKFMPCDLMREASEKRSGWRTYFLDELKPFIDELYLAALVQGEVLFVHGGVSSKVKGFNDLRQPSKRVEEDVLWSDPFEGYGEHLNVRGAGIMFGKDVSEEVCRRLSLKRIVRSHQPRKAKEGPCVEHDGKIVTISSTIIYGGTPFILALPAKSIDEAFRHLERYTVIFK
jgi:diadenosine tetraphosphatase ApaH/serine/threonine PP2A family protein phosphatase